ncbi:MAG TPA: MG2 domain-containing protein, partial [Anaerolineae bacterium]|nr:MG2 domain-containing protein [Anaerolineae bacterium]
PNTYLRVFINEEITGPDNTPLANNKIEFRTASALYAHLTTNTPPTNLQPSFNIRFTVDMDKSSVSRALSLDPPLDYTTAWDDKNLTLRLTQPLQPTDKFTITINNTAHSLNNIPLYQPLNHQHQTTPLLDPLTIRQKNNKTYIILDFNYPVQPASVDKALQLSPHHLYETSWPNPQKAILTLSENLAINQQYHLNFNTKINLLTGPPHQPRPITFNTPPPKLITNHTPFHPLIIEFPYSVNPHNNFPKIAVFPETDYTLSWNDNNTQLIITPDTYFPPLTDHAIYLYDHLYNQNNQPIFHNFWHELFATESFPDLGTFGDGLQLQIINSELPRTIPVFLNKDVRTIANFRLYQTDIDTILDQYLNDNLALNKLTTFDTSDLPLVTQWQHTNFTANQFDPALPQIPTNIPPGTYLLEMGINDDTTAQLFLILTPLGLHIEQNNNTYHIWTAQLTTTQTTTPTQLTFYDTNNTIIHQTTTNDHAIYTYTPPATATLPIHILAQRDQQFAFTTINAAWEPHPHRNQNLAAITSPPYPRHTLYTITDKPSYQAGDTLHFKTIARQLTTTQTNNLPLGTPILTQLTHHENNEPITQITTSLNDYGATAASINLPPTLTHGLYQLHTTLNNQTFTHQFTISPPPTPYIIDIIPSQPYYVQNETIRLNIHAYHQHQTTPLNNQKAEIHIYNTTNTDKYTTLHAYPNTAYRPSYDYENEHTFSATGQITVEFTANIGYPAVNTPQTNQLLNELLIVVNTTDEDGHPISASRRLTIYETHATITMDTHGRLHAANQSHPVDLTLLGNDHQPHPNTPVKITLATVTPDNQQQDTTIYGTTDHNGQATLNIPPLPPGEYKLKANTADSSFSSITNDFIILTTDTNDDWHTFHAYSNLYITPEKNSYFAGQTARLFIQTQHTGPALLTLSNDKITASQIVSLTAPFTILNLPITQQHTPNLYLSLTQLQPNFDQQNTVVRNLRTEANAYYATAIINLDVPPHHQQLTLSIRPDQTDYQAGQPVTLTLQVNNTLGQPVATEITLAINPQTLLTTPPNPPPFTPTFYPPSFYGITQHNNYALGRHNWNDHSSAYGPGPTPQPITHLNYPTTLPSFWYPSLRTNALGQAQITLTWPETPTTWLLSAHAFTTDTQIGTTTLTLTTQ